MQWTKMLTRVLGGAVLLAATVAPMAAQDADPSATGLQARVDDFVGLLPGGVAVVTIRDDVRTGASAGIADADGTPLGVDSPMLVGGATAYASHVLVLQLADEGLIDLDDAIADHVAEVPAPDGATVRDLLNGRAGMADVPAEIWDVEADPDRIWTREDIIASVDPEATSFVGDLTDGYAHTLVLQELVEAVTGADFATVLGERISGPLGMSATRRPDGAPADVGDVAGGWITAAGEPVYQPNTSNAIRSARPMVSTANDIATFTAALFRDQLLSPEMLAATVLDESVDRLGYGILRPDEMSSVRLLGPTDDPWFGMDAASASGTNTMMAVAPGGEDVLVVLSNNADLDARALARAIVSDWQAAAPTTAVASDGVAGTLRYAAMWLCNAGQPTGFELPDCVVDDRGQHILMELPYILTGPLEGIGTYSGIVTIAPDNTFTGDGKVVFMGEVEGCGAGTLYFTAADAEGFFDGPVTTYTQHAWEIVPGGTLPVVGSLELIGAESRPDDYSAELDYEGKISCVDEGAAGDA